MSGRHIQMLIVHYSVTYEEKVQEGCKPIRISGCRSSRPSGCTNARKLLIFGTITSTAGDIVFAWMTHFQVVYCTGTYLAHCGRKRPTHSYTRSEVRAYRGRLNPELETRLPESCLPRSERPRHGLAP